MTRFHHDSEGSPARRAYADFENTGILSGERSRTISAKVFVGNLNYRTTKEELIAFLSPAGEIIDAFLPTDRETGRPRGFGFITFATEDQAQACIEQFDGVEMSGRRLNINKADDRGRGAKPSRREPATEFKRGGPGGGRPPRSGGGGDGRRDDRGGGGRGGPRPPRPPRGDAPPLPGTEPEYTTEDRRDPDASDEPTAETDEWGQASQPWKKKKKKSKGSRRGLRSKKRSL